VAEVICANKLVVSRET